MKSHFSLFASLLLSVLLFSTGLKAQIANRISTFGSERSPDALNLAFTGKVQVEGDADLEKDTVVVLECGSKVRASSNVDRRGDFSLVLNGAHGSKRSPWNNSEATDPRLTDCTLYAQAGGYRSAPVSLAGEQTSGIVRVGTLVLQPLSGPRNSTEDFTINVASLAAPEKARQQFEKGKEQERKGKWAAAAEHFRNAIEVYPRYAIAWLELGRSQLRQNNFADAQQSFQKAASQDSKLLPAYVELARMQAEQKEWKALADTAGKMVQLAPEASPLFWFLDSAANYNLHDLARAESSATRGLRLDSSHQVPQLEYLYGMILATRKDYSAAAQHVKNYLQLVPKATDGENARKVLADFERLASITPAQP